MRLTRENLDRFIDFIRNERSVPNLEIVGTEEYVSRIVSDISNKAKALKGNGYSGPLVAYIPEHIFDTLTRHFSSQAKFEMAYDKGVMWGSYIETHYGRVRLIPKPDVPNNLIIVAEDPDA